MSEGVGDVARDLDALVRENVPALRAIDEAGSRRTRGPGTWSRKQVLGHVIDSALNNVHRFVRARSGGELRFPDYDQPLWVDAGGYQEREWASLVTLWGDLNEHLVRVIERIPPEALGVACRIGDSQPLTLEYIVRDYVRHLRHHLEQILDPETSAGRTHPPFA